MIFGPIICRTSDARLRNAVGALTPVEPLGRWPARTPLSGPVARDVPRRSRTTLPRLRQIRVNARGPFASVSHRDGVQGQVARAWSCRLAGFSFLFGGQPAGLVRVLTSTGWTAGATAAKTYWVSTATDAGWLTARRLVTMPTVLQSGRETQLTCGFAAAAKVSPRSVRGPLGPFGPRSGHADGS